MARFATAAFRIVILSRLINLSAANKDGCDLYAAVGASQDLPLMYKGLTNQHDLEWTHNSTSNIIFYRHKGRVSVGKATDVFANGSLLLNTVQFSSAGVYQAKVWFPNGTRAGNWTGRLCVADKVSKPILTYVCDFKSSSVRLSCNATKTQGLLFSWTLDERTLANETKQTLSVSLTRLNGARNLTCDVANPVSRQRSVSVRPACRPPKPSPPVLLCFKPAAVLAAVAVGGSLILLLLIVVGALCCCYNCKKMPLGKGNVSMLSLSKRPSAPGSPDYETMRPGESASSNAYNVNVSKPEDPTGTMALDMALDLPTAEEPKRLSPVPKPRTKAAII